MCIYVHAYGYRCNVGVPFVCPYTHCPVFGVYSGSLCLEIPMHVCIQVIYIYTYIYVYPYSRTCFPVYMYICRYMHICIYMKIHMVCSFLGPLGLEPWLPPPGRSPGRDPQEAQGGAPRLGALCGESLCSTLKIQ